MCGTTEPWGGVRHAAQFAVVVLLAVSLAASTVDANCCARCPKANDTHQTPAHNSAASDPCAHQMRHALTGRGLEAATPHVNCHACSCVAARPVAGSVVSDGTSGFALAHANMQQERAPRVTVTPQLPENPPALTSNSKQAVLHTFLI